MITDHTKTPNRIHPFLGGSLRVTPLVRAIAGHRAIYPDGVATVIYYEWLTASDEGPVWRGEDELECAEESQP